MTTLLTKGDFRIRVHDFAPEDKKEKYTDEKTLGFGQIFTDRMFYQEFKDGSWQEAQIKKFEPISLPPSSCIFHYAQEFFEGMKAYYHPNGDIALFRPEKNAKRFNSSATRLVMPHVNPEFFVWALEELVKLEKDWIPKTTKGASLDLRPTMIATESFLGVRPSAT
ncbi:MAG: branched chain amino acid aminotransferase, partial [Promethearchaeota archaeon]